MSINGKLPYSEIDLTRRRLKPNLRRAQLLEHAISAFADAGIERAAHADVAGRAKVSTPTVFKYFPTRAVLVDAVLEEIEQTFQDLNGGLPKESATAAQVIRAATLALTYLCDTRPDLMKVALTWSVAFSPIRARYLRFEARVLEILSTALDPNLSNPSDKYIIFNTGNLFVRMHFDDTPPDVRRDYVNRMCQLMECCHTPITELEA